VKKAILIASLFFYTNIIVGSDRQEKPHYQHPIDNVRALIARNRIPLALLPALPTALCVHRYTDFSLGQRIGSTCLVCLTSYLLAKRCRLPSLDVVAMDELEPTLLQRFWVFWRPYLVALEGPRPVKLHPHPAIRVIEDKQVPASPTSEQTEQQHAKPPVVDEQKSGGHEWLFNITDWLDSHIRPDETPIVIEEHPIREITPEEVVKFIVDNIKAYNSSQIPQFYYVETSDTGFDGRPAVKEMYDIVNAYLQFVYERKYGGVTWRKEDDEQERFWQERLLACVKNQYAAGWRTHNTMHIQFRNVLIE